MGNAVSAIAVANTFLEFAKEEGRSVTHMELQKYTFFAHAWHLGYTDEPLISDQIQAWKFGPVIPKMYHAFKGFGNAPIDKYGVEFNVAKCEVNAPVVREGNLRVFLRKVWDAYKKYSAGALSSMSHELGGPWAQVYQETGTGPVRNLPIPNEVIARFYGQRAKGLNRA